MFATPSCRGADVFAPGALAEEKIGDRSAADDDKEQYAGGVRRCEHVGGMLRQEDQCKSRYADPYAVSCQKAGNGEEFVPVEVESITDHR